MKTRRYLLLAGALLMASASLTGCHKKQDQVNYTDIEQLGEFDTTRNITISFYHTMGKELQDKLSDYIEQFNEIYPNITVEHRQIGTYNDVRDQLSKDLSVGSSANISYCYPDHVASYLKSNKVLNMDLFAEDTKYGYGFSEEEKADFIESYYNEGKQFGDGHLYCLPFSKSTEVLYYNKDFFDANGYEVPTTWDEMEELCRTIKAAHPNDVPLGYDSSSNLFITMCEQLNSPYTSADTNNESNSHFLFKNETNINFVKRLRGWYKDGLITTADTLGAGGNKLYTSSIFTQKDPELPRSYMCIGSSAGASYQRQAGIDSEIFDTGITEIPCFDPNNKKVISQGPSVCIFQDSDPQKVIASWLLVKYLTTSVEFQAEFSKTSGYVPVIKSVFDNLNYKAWLSRANGKSYIQARSCKVCKEQADHYFTSPAFNGSADARDAVGTLVYRAMISSSESAIPGLFDEAIGQCELSSL